MCTCSNERGEERSRLPFGNSIRQRFPKGDRSHQSRCARVFNRLFFASQVGIIAFI